MLPKKARKAAGDASYAIGLLVLVALLAIALVPLSVHLMGWAFSRHAEISRTDVGLILAANVLTPMGAGLVVRHVARKFAERIAVPISLFASILLMACIPPILFTATPAILSLIGNGTLIAIVAFVLVGLAAGQLLGGPDPANRAVLALTTSSRHPGVAASIASVNFPQQKLVLPAILLYLLVNVLIFIWYKKLFGQTRVDATGR